MSEAALRAAQQGLDAASALTIGATRFDVAAYAQRGVGGGASVGARAELVRRITQAISVGVSGYAEREIGNHSTAYGASVFGRVDL